MPVNKKSVKVSERQKKLATELMAKINNGERIDKKELLKKSGYSGTTLINPSQVFSSEGIQAALIQAGLTPDKMSKVLMEAQEARKGTFYKGEYCETDKADHDVRLKALNLQAEVLGIKKQVIEQKGVNVNVDYKDIKDLF